MFRVSEELRNKTVEYLAGKAAGEVLNLMNAWLGSHHCEKINCMPVEEPATPVLTEGAKVPEENTGKEGTA